MDLKFQVPPTLKFSPEWPYWLLDILDYGYDHRRKMRKLLVYQYGPKQEAEDWWLNLEFGAKGGGGYAGRIGNYTHGQPHIEFYMTRLSAATQFFNELVDPNQWEPPSDLNDQISFCFVRILEAVLDIISHPQWWGFESKTIPDEDDD